MADGARELRALTGMRGVAAWLVVAFHLRLAPAGLPGGVAAVLAKGYLAVDFFFLLSGFVIWMSWAERLRTRGLAEVPAFLKRRIARIWPLHLAMLGFAVALAALLALTGRELPADFPLAQLPLHVLLVQNWGFTDALAWNDPAWSISAEWGAYLVFPFIALTIDWARMPRWGCVAAILGLAVLLHLIFALGGAATLGTDIPRFGLIRCIVEFTIGGALCSLWMRAQNTRGWTMGSAAVALGVGGATIAGRVPEMLGVPLAFGAGLLALALTSHARGNPLASRPLHWLGEISYATYLSHFLLWFAFKLAFVDAPRAVPSMLLAAYAVTVLLASAALYHGLEKPAQAAINRLALPRRARPLVR